LGTLLIGTAVGTFFNGAQFSLNEYNQVTWQTATRGLEAVLTFHNVALGLAVFFLSRVLALLYFNNSIDNDEIIAKVRKQLIYNTIPFLAFFLYFVGALMLKDGFAYDPASLKVSMVENHYAKSLIAMPLVFITFLLGVVAVLLGIYTDLVKTPGKGIWFSGVGTVLTVFALFLLAGYNNTCYYPSAYELQSSLNIRNSSSSEFTLKVMSIVSLMIPFVMAYIWYAWKAINNKKIDEAEMNEEGHKY